MKKLLIFTLSLLLLTGASFATRAVDWTINHTTTEAEYLYCPSAGIFQDIGARTVNMVVTSTGTTDTFGIQYYQSNGASLLSTEVVTPKTAKTLLSPFFRLYVLTEAGGTHATAEVYILN